MIRREIYEKGSAQLFVDKHPDGSQHYYIQVGFAGIELRTHEVLDTHDLLHALVEEITNG